MSMFSSFWSGNAVVNCKIINGGKQVLKGANKYCMIREEIKERASGEGSAA